MTSVFRLFRPLHGALVCSLLAGAFALHNDFDGARAALAEARRLRPEIDSLARWREYQPWIAVPHYRALREQTLNVGLRRAGFPEQ